jgi:hypothetical protein
MGQFGPGDDSLPPVPPLPVNEQGRKLSNEGRPGQEKEKVARTVSYVYVPRKTLPVDG